MRFDVITLFPDMVRSAIAVGITGRAIESKIIDLFLWNPRDFTVDKHRTVDDRPYGGGPGMVMKYQPVHDALAAAKHVCGKTGKVVYLSPQGKTISQELLAQAAQMQRLILIAGRYEGIDERIIEKDCDEEWSLGDFVLSGGELAALVIIDGITRLLPGALGDDESATQDSYADGLLDCPHYTRPQQINGASVPSVLMNGNHADIKRWRLQQALGKTWQKRPDLLDKKELTEEQKLLLKEFIKQSELN